MEEIEKIHVTKFLGVYIDYRFDWKSHIDHIINKVSKSISIIYRASQMVGWLCLTSHRQRGHLETAPPFTVPCEGRGSQKLNETALLMLYNTMILPYLSYCSEVWGITYITNLNPLFVKQNNFLRIKGRLGRFDHTTPLFLNFKILKLFDLFECNASCFMYLVCVRKLPKYTMFLCKRYS